METAAQGSYAYWVAMHTDTPPTDDQKERFAIRECRRHIFGVKYEDAVGNIKETCKFRRVSSIRYCWWFTAISCCLWIWQTAHVSFSFGSSNFQERRIDLYRAAFTEGVVLEDEKDAAEVEKIKAMITTDIKKQHCYVRGKDKDGRALLVIHPRTDKHTVDEEFVAMMVYIMERAAAATEFTSRGIQEKLLVVLDFGTFKSSLAPPMSAIKALSAILQSRYSERLKNLVILDPPFWMRTMYGLIKPFLDPVTKAKFIVATGGKKKTETISAHVNPEDATPLMLPEGKLVGEVDLDRFLNTVPFHCLYDDA